MPETLRRKRVLVIPHDLNEPGGGTCVGAWVLMALKDDYDVSVLTWAPPDLRIANRNFGTTLEPSDFRWHTVDARIRKLLAMLPSRLSLLQNQIIFRKAKRLRREGGIDLVIGAANEIDVGAPAIQYIHFPWAYWPRPDCDLRWYHFAPLVRLYRRCSTWISGYDGRSVPRNSTLTNSDWTGRLFASCYRDARWRTLYPPVPGGFSERPFEDRKPVFACIGRMAPEKRFEDIIEILARVRSVGHDVGLRIIGHKENGRYLRTLTRAAAPHRSWISFHHGVARSEMAELVSECRYGIHAMEDEHFGIAVAELQRAGCIPFLRSGGGAPEIVDHDERLVFESVDDAVRKIDRVLRDNDLQSALEKDVERRRPRFTEERFVAEIREIVESMVARKEGAEVG